MARACNGVDVQVSLARKIRRQRGHPLTHANTNARTHTNTHTHTHTAKSLEELDSQITKAKLYDAGTGIITGDPEEPLYGRLEAASSVSEAALLGARASVL